MKEKVEMVKCEKKTVLIGPMFSDPAESVSAVNRAFVAGLADRYEFICASTEREHGTTRQSRFNAWNLWYSVKHTFSWFKTLRADRPDIAHYAVSSGWAMEKSLLLLALARWSGAATFGHLHSGGFLDHWQKLSGWRRALALRQLKKLDGFIVLSEWWRERIAEVVGVPEERLWVVNNPLDPVFEEAALALPVGRGGGCLLSIGTVGRDKGVFELIEACRMLKEGGIDFHLELQGPERDPGIQQELRKILKMNDLEERVKLGSGVFGQDKLERFRESSIFVLPSYYENFPLVVLEAAASGQAIVTTPVGAVPEFFKDGVSALFVKERNSENLTTALRQLLAEPERAYKLGAEARSVFKNRLGRNRILDSLCLAYESKFVSTRQMLDAKALQV